jgi:hypothetical protein
MEYTLKSGRKVELRELTMLDDVLCTQLVGENLTEEAVQKNPYGNGYMQAMVECVLAIVKYDGQDILPPKDVSDAFKIMKMIPKRDGDEIFKLHKELNKDVDEGK